MIPQANRTFWAVALALVIFAAMVIALCGWRH